MWSFLAKNIIFAIVWGGQKALESCEQDMKNEALSIHLLLWENYNHCLTMAVAIIVWKNVKLNFCHVFFVL